MPKPNLTGSAALHKRIGSFGGLFIALAVYFPPIAAFALALGACMVLAKM